MTPSLDYGEMVQNAMRRVVHDALRHAILHGLPGQHHFYITFRSDDPGVTMPDALRARYPREMTIVLQHEFWALEVDDAGFGVTLSFNNVPSRIEVPFGAVTVFADPSVQFGLQFTDADAGEEGAAEGSGEPTGRAEGETAMGRKDADPTTPEGGADVVALDRFRKK